MSKLLRRANKRISLSGAATLLVAASILGQLLGFFRTKLINANFPAYGPESTDAFFAAFKIPDFFFFTIAAGALGVAFMPFLADRLEKGDKNGMWELTDSLLNLLAILTGIVGILILVFARPLIQNVVAPDLSPEQLNNAVAIMRLIALNPMLFTISGILTSAQQTLGRFFFYAIAPLFYNMSIIAGIFLFKDSFGLVGAGIGACIGGVLQLIIVALGMYGTGFKYYPKIMWRRSEFKQIVRQLPARSVDQGLDSLNSIVETNFAARLGPGNITFYENAYLLHTAPILLIGTTISTAAFPRLTERLAQNRSDLFRKDFLEVLRVMIWITIPVMVVAFFSRAYLARLIYAKGSPEIATILGFLVGAIFFRTIFALISRWFYAQKDTATPLYVSLFAIGLNITLAYTLTQHSSYGIAGLAMAQSIAAAIEVFVLCCIMVYRDRKLLDSDFWNAMLKVVAVTGFTVVAADITTNLIPLQLSDVGLFVLGFKLVGITAITFSIHLALSHVMGLEEPRPVLRKLRSMALKTVRL